MNIVLITISAKADITWSFESFTIDHAIFGKTSLDYFTLL